MSIDLNWETLTTGPDGLELAHRIRDFIHTKFQSVPLPRFIKSVTVHDFEFGSIPPQLELKDITDPLPDFYEENPAADDEDSDEGFEEEDVPYELRAAAERRKRTEEGKTALPPHITTAGLHHPYSQAQDLGSPFLGVSTPGIPGGTSNLSYFHSHLATGLSGTQTPLAAVAGAHLGSGWLDAGHDSPHHQLRHQSIDNHAPSHNRHPSQSSVNSEADINALSGMTPLQPLQQALREKSSVSTLAPTSTGASSRPPTRDASTLVESAIDEDEDGDDDDGQDKAHRRFREPRIEDIQAVFRIKYAGDVKLLLTADILLDYPMPSFVGIPLRLSITGLTFDGIGVAAYIRKRVHFCFLSPEDALAAVGADTNEDGLTGENSPARGAAKFGGLLQEIRVESEIGQREGTKQSLKNVGKVERFVLEQVRRIFEEEFVYPSFWTFLV
ncbi:putative mitochondrial inheritance component mdm12 protein [Phaeoacremonium minimum UCRPA7]|uniref:Mitochondrial distribution and morphology protein 12 n=1 Tax=Phaeoacremonium minimum (strain UCR-PA7) TaxID=1286976 RepID=R8BGB3_PHAM7|nr:putative mitochondrial inheritance component mdm12 protein [Phaeoacremonium minimum UCRPA7]EON98334.1 putative mitochondrial inheritance component mdm12 protein [Phaeoacremonium minimum UCRPA7]